MGRGRVGEGSALFFSAAPTRPHHLLVMLSLINVSLGRFGAQVVRLGGVGVRESGVEDQFLGCLFYFSRDKSREFLFRMCSL